MSDLLTREWITKVVADAASDPIYRRTTRGYRFTLRLTDGRVDHTVALADGQVQQLDPSGDQPADVTLRGDRTAWEHALVNARELAATSGSGLTLSGDSIVLYNHALPLSRLWLAMQGKIHNAPGATADHSSTPRHEPEIVGRYVTLNGFRTYYEEAGAGRAVLAIHSGGADGRVFRHLLPFLASHGYRAIAVDMPGHGKSYPDLDSLRLLDSTTEWIQFVLDFSSALDLDRPILIGCAMSGSLLLSLAAQHPDAAAAVISTGGTVDFTRSLSEDFLDAINHPQVNGSDLLESVTPGMVGPHLSAEAHNECRWHNARNLTPEVMQTDLRVYATHDSTSLLADITVPVLHLHCEYDPAVSPEDLRKLREDVPQVSMQELSGVGHFPMIEDPARYNDAVHRWLSTLTDPSTGADSGPIAEGSSAVTG